MAISIKELKDYSSTIDWIFSTSSDGLLMNDASINLTIKSNDTHQISYDTTNSIFDTDNDTLETPYEDYKYRPETYMVPIIFSMIFIVGVLGNGTLIVVFIKHRAMRNVPNT